MNRVDSDLMADRARHEIERLKYRYWRACDAKDPIAFRACFVREGGILDYGPLGRLTPDQMAKVFQRIALAPLPDGSPRVLDMHHGFMPVIDVEMPTDGSAPVRAIGRWTLQFRQVERVAGTETVSTGEYSDTYALEDGRWVIVESLFSPGWSITRPTDDATVIPAPGTSTEVSR